MNRTGWHARSIVAGLILLMAAGGCATVGKDVPGIHNFDTVQAGTLYRGGQPTEQGFHTLEEKGIRTVIDLRDDPVRGERNGLAREGIAYVPIPSKPTRADPRIVRAFLETMRTAPRPVFVHCRQGRDRTGLEVAAYRIAEQGWSRTAAIKELHEHGYNWFIFPGIEKFLQSFQADDLQARQ
jgi:protein tyrosine/serine phosphatase